MFKINKFAKICGCSTQTIRYYDKKDLLKPYYIEKMTGYRYYILEQVLDFYKIREFQSVGFKINEIKILIKQDDDFVLTQLNNKLLVHQDIIAKTVKLQNSYLKKKKNMEEYISLINEELSSFDVAKSNNNIDIIIEDSKASLSFIQSCQPIYDLLLGMKEHPFILLDKETLELINNNTWRYHAVYHDWNLVTDISELIPKCTVDSKHICLLFNINPNISLYDIYELMLIIEKGGYNNDNVLITVSLSTDKKNHFALLYSI